MSTGRGLWREEKQSLKVGPGGGGGGGGTAKENSLIKPNVVLPHILEVGSQIQKYRRQYIDLSVNGKRKVLDKVPESAGQSHKTVSTNHNLFWKRKESRSSIEPRSFRLPALRLTARPNRLTTPNSDTMDLYRSKVTP